MDGSRVILADLLLEERKLAPQSGRGAEPRTSCLSM